MRNATRSWRHRSSASRTQARPEYKKSGPRAAFSFQLFDLLRLATVTSEVIHIQQVEPSADIFPTTCDGLMDAVKVFAGSHIAGRPALLPARPLDDFPRTGLGCGVGLDPDPDFRVARTFGRFFTQGFSANSKERKATLIQRAVVMVLTALLGERGAAFIEHARQGNNAADADAGASWRMNGEIRL